MTDRMTLFFEPLDVLQFRDHRPSDAGYHTLAESRFPLPSVFLGCIRTALFRSLGADFHARDEHFGIEQGWAHALLGGRSAPGSLCPRGPLVACRAAGATSKTPAAQAVEPYLPPPLDLIAIAPDATDPPAGRRTHAIQRFADLRGHAVRLHARRGALAPVEGPIPWSAREPEKRAEPLMLTLAGARRYIEAVGHGDRSVDLGDGGQVARSRLLVQETRVGIARAPDTMTAEDHMLYVQRPFRLALGHGFAVDVAAGMPEARAHVEALDGAVLPLGGKAHHARVHVHAGALLPGDLDTADGDDPGHTDGCALWFLTPMPLRPELEGWPEGISAVTERAVRLGGIDLSKNEPRPLAPALPAGTVVHARGMTPGDALAKLGGDIDEIRRRGLGLAVTWPL